jgi:hypothetical protein
VWRIAPLWTIHPLSESTMRSENAATFNRLAAAILSAFSAMT